MSCSICRSSWAGVIIDQRAGYFTSVGGWLADLAAVLRLIGQSSINESSWWWHLSGNAVVVVMIGGLLSFLHPQGLVCTHNPKDRTQWPRTHCKFQEWKPHLNAGVSPVNHRSMCVRNSTHSRSNICRLAGVNKRLAVRYVPFLLTKDCFCPSIWTKSWPLLPLIDVQCCVYAREAALESAVLLGCHVLMFSTMLFGLSS